MTPGNYPRVGVGGVIIRDDEVLLQLRAKAPEAQHWNIPGGKMEWGERVEDALLRELDEELGARFVINELLCVTNHIVLADNVHWVSLAYWVELASGTPTNMEPDSTIAVRWFPLTDLPNPLTRTAENALSRLMQKLKQFDRKSAENTLLNQ